MSKTKKATAVDDTAIVMQQNRRNRGARGDFPSEFGNISIGEGRLCPPYYYWPHPDFQIVLRPCAVGSLPAICRKWVIKIRA